MKARHSPPSGRRIRHIEELRTHLQTAIELEHATLPPYLCALYSIHDGANREAAALIRGVVMEEMLHLVQAANVLNAIGGHPDLCHPKFIPEYPTGLPHSNNAFQVNLLKFSPEAIETFLKIERPAQPGAKPQAHGYATIGQFYEAIRQGLQRICRDNAHFIKNHGLQVTPEAYYGGVHRVATPAPGGQTLRHRVPIPVTDLPSALSALDVIMEQGEGLDHTLFSGDADAHMAGIHAEDEEWAHYFRFNEILHGRHYGDGQMPTEPPAGTLLPVDWTAVYPMTPNPKMKAHEGTPAHPPMVEFNATYMTLLRSLHDALNGQPDQMQRSVAVMYQLKYQAVALMKMPSGRNDGLTAGPSFEYLPETS